jgi:uncharacterized protein YdhG (YjbR/CyaY superfamily)
MSCWCSQFVISGKLAIRCRATANNHSEAICWHRGPKSKPNPNRPVADGCQVEPGALSKQVEMVSTKSWELHINPYRSFANGGKMSFNTAQQPENGPMTAGESETHISTVDGYIATSAKEVQPILRKLRTTIRRAVPQATEFISYRMPAYKLNGMIMYFAAFKQHIGVFPPVRGTATFVKAVKPYAGPKGNLRFPLAKPIPYSLIARIAKQRAKDNLDQAAIKKASNRSQKPRSLRNQV